MKSFLNIIVLALVTKSAFAVPTLPTVPPEGEKNQKFAQELLDHALDAIDAVKTYRGAMIVERTIRNSANELKFQRDSLRMRSQWRINRNGDKAGEWAISLFDGERARENTSRNARIVDDGKRMFVSYGEAKAWSREKRDPEPAFRVILREGFQALSRAADDSAFVPFVEARLEGGRPTYVVSEANKGVKSRFRVVVDAEKHFLRSFQLNRRNTQIELRLFDQEFAPKLDEKLFVWRAPRGSRQVKAGTVELEIGKTLSGVSQ